MPTESSLFFSYRFLNMLTATQIVAIPRNAGSIIFHSSVLEFLESSSSEASEESFEELDLIGTVEEEDGGGLEFDIDDFIEDMDDDKSKSSGSADIDLNLDDK